MLLSFLACFAQIVEGQQLTNTFSFTNTVGSVSGTVTGLIFGLPLNGVNQPAQEIMITSVPNALSSYPPGQPIITDPSYAVSTNTFTTVNGVVTAASFIATANSRILLINSPLNQALILFGGDVRNAGGFGGVTFGVSSGASSDPHMVGPNGETFDFDGQPDGVYTLASSPHVVVNMKLAANGPKERFMTEIGVVAGNVTLAFDTIARPNDFVATLNAQLAPIGAKAVELGPFSTLLLLCDGHSIKITQMRTAAWVEQKLNLNATFYYLDVEFDAPGCHDEFGGVLGQLYHCDFVSGKRKFEWDASTEESFRVAALDATSAPFDAELACGAGSTTTTFGAKPTSVAKAT